MDDQFAIASPLQALLWNVTIADLRTIVVTLDHRWVSYQGDHRDEYKQAMMEARRIYDLRA